MKVRNIINKAAVIGTGALMTGFTVSSALAYDLANYPAQFIVDGAFDGKIVVGANAATSDVLGAIDIAASLQAGSVTSETVEIPGQAGSVNLQGDAFKIERQNDMLEIREAIGDVYESLTEDELEALRGGRVTTSRGATNYQQFLRFGESGNADFQPFAVNLLENRDNELADYLVVDSNASFFEYELEFTEGLKSRVTLGSGENMGSFTGASLRDMEGRTINMFGTDFTIVRASATSGSPEPSVTLELMAGDVEDVLREGETKTYTIDGVDYTVQAVFISDPNTGDNEARFAVNGELTNSLREGDTDTLNSGLELGVRNILTHSREGIVEFFLGADKLLFEGSNVEVGNDRISEADVEIVASVTGNDVEITSIRYTLEANAQRGRVVYVPSGHGVREFLDEPRGLLSPTFDIRYEGLTQEATTPIELRARGDHSYELSVTNLRGREFSDIPFVSNRGTTGSQATALEWGEDGRDAFWFTKPDLGLAGQFTPADVQAALDNSSVANNTVFWINWDDYFVVSSDSLAQALDSDKTDSAIIRYIDIDTDDKRIFFEDASTGTEIPATYVEVTGQSGILGYVETNFRVEGRSYQVWIGNSSEIGLDDYPIAVDVDRTGVFDGTTVPFTTHGGATLVFDTTGVQTAGEKFATGDSFIMNLSIPQTRFDTANGDEVLEWNISREGAEEIRLSGVDKAAGPLSQGNDLWSRFRIEDDASDRDLDVGLLDYGAFVHYRNPSGDAQSLTIEMPRQQVAAQVFVTAGAVDRSAGGPGGVMREVVSPIAVGLAVLDRDAAGMYGNENLIIVGGPCANTVAAQFLGNPANCAEGFTPGRAGIWAESMNGNVAILVAGYEAQDTLGAAYVLADYDTYLSGVEGSSVEVVATDLSNLRVQAPTVLEAPAEAEAEEAAMEE